jgi:hypothetical protein
MEGTVEPDFNTVGQLSRKGIWIGIAVGAAVGIGIALSRRKKTRWQPAREMTGRIADRSSEPADATRDIVDRVQTIHEERNGEDASDLWSHGRKLASIDPTRPVGIACGPLFAPGTSSFSRLSYLFI